MKTGRYKSARPPARRVTPEAQVKRAITEYCTLVLHGMVERFNAGSVAFEGRRIHMGHAGRPDLVVLLPGGRVVFIECKAAHGKLSDAQQHWHDEAGKRGHVVIVARSVDDVAAILGPLPESIPEAVYETNLGE